jgi:PEP-CTERM motif
MKTIRKALFGAGLAGLTMAATAAEATVYIGTDVVGVSSINLSVTTDGTLGTLAAANITDWNVVLVDPNSNNSFTFTPLNSRITVFGDAVSATASNLTFDFASAGTDAFQFYEDPSANPFFIRYYCIDTGFLCQGSDGRRRRGLASSAATVADINGGSRERFQFEARSGLGVIGTAPAVGAVPEPASWAMMIFGFGLVGNVMRRRALVRISAKV